LGSALPGKKIPMRTRTPEAF